MPAPSQITRCLLAWQQNSDDTEIGDELYRLTYRQLRAIAQRRLLGESEAAITPTELVHEAWFGLKPTGKTLECRSQFFRLASRVMRNLLVDRARERLAAN